MQEIKITIYKVKPYELSNKEQEILDSQVQLDKNLYTDAELLYTDLIKKYNL
ncbi:hypothetical protein NJT12_11990 [Flavobacterium sp. AC]|uniref:Uncharacterized protein n=1 Tax=Flavobacterium azizsancarii TaxID=2961580 RepID=A0ABT4WCS2_9FLAO|nr:hypothetical protein [Flavobacterium azizsancarii]MDA6070341.1 hypothetical protein [Flavobacterium azizsancarii]